MHKHVVRYSEQSSLHTWRRGDYNLAIETVLRIRISLNKDPDTDPAFQVNTDPDLNPAFQVNTDPDPGFCMTNL